MRLFAMVAILGLAMPAFPYIMKYTVSHDSLYDDGGSPLTNVACSYGEHGLRTIGYTTFDSLPTYPYVGGAPQVKPWNSQYCGTCWELTYTDPQGYPTSLNFTAINTGDGTPKGFTISLEGMDHLTHGDAEWQRMVPITVARLPKSSCGL